MSLLIVLGVLVSAVVSVLRSPLRLLVVLLLLGLVGLALWYALTRAGGVRVAAITLAIAVIVALAALVVASPNPWVVGFLIPLALATMLARYAVSRDLATLKRSATAGTPVPAARRGVLIINLRSGGGKAERFGLVEECRRRGIEPVVLQPGDDLPELARAAIDGGADVVGMAGGDGSQALVAAVAAQRHTPMVVVPAGTRNHLALDLGIDRADVVGALDAFGEAVERPMDLADVNGRPFVNNVSLGLYATIVASDAYRDAKVDTTLAALPGLLGPGARPIDLRFRGPDGEHHDQAHVIQVSNGQYGKTLLTLGSRPRLDDGKLGVAALVLPDDRAARRFLAALATGRPFRYAGLQTWETDTFEVGSGDVVQVGLDGEAVQVEPPLRFTIRPGALRVRLSPHAIGYSPAARSADARRYVRDLCTIAVGREVETLA